MAQSSERTIAAVAIGVGLLALGVFGVRWWRGHAGRPDMSRGGVELIYDVDVGRAVDRRFSLALDQVVERLRADGVALTAVAPEARSATVSGPELDVARVQRAAEGTSLEVAMTSREGAVMVKLPEAVAASTAEAAMQQSARVIYSRLDKVGWCQPMARQSGTRLVVDIPALDPGKVERLKEIIRIGGLLEFREIDGGEALVAIAAALPAGSPIHLTTDRWHQAGAGELEGRVLESSDAAALEAFRATMVGVPGGMEALIERREASGMGDEARSRLYLVRRRAEVTGEQISEVDWKRDENTRRPTVTVAFDRAGAAAFEAATGRLTGHKLAIVLDGKVLSAPVIQSKIGGGRATITLGSAGDPKKQEAEAQDLVAALRSGALPAPLTLASENTVGPMR